MFNLFVSKKTYDAKVAEHNQALTDLKAKAARDIEPLVREIASLKAQVASVYGVTNWKAQGYKTREEEINDMANVGRSLMERIAGVVEPGGEMAGWNPMDDPAEIVTDMANTIYELRIINEANGPDALLWRSARERRANAKPSRAKSPAKAGKKS